MVKTRALKKKETRALNAEKKLVLVGVEQLRGRGVVQN